MNMVMENDINKNRPEGLDFLAIAIAVLWLYVMAMLLGVINPIFAIVGLFIMLYNWKLIKQALWQRNIFKPLMLHLIWGFIVVMSYAGILKAIFDDTRVDDFLRYFLFAAYFLCSTILLPIMYKIYSVGNKYICKSMPNSRPQGNFVKLVVSMGLIIVYMYRRNRIDEFTASFYIDDINTAADMNSSGSSIAGVVGNAAATVVPDATLIDIDSTGNDIAGVDSDMTSTIESGDSVVNFADSMGQADGTAVVHADDSVDLLDSNMQSAGHITDGGLILNSLNLPDGRIEGNNIFDAQNQLAYTIEGDTIYNKLHQVAFIIRDGNVYGNTNQLLSRTI